MWHSTHFHQHFIVARLNLDVDGPDNTVDAVSSEASGDDPYGLGLVVRETPLRTEAERSRTTTGPYSAA